MSMEAGRWESLRSPGETEGDECVHAAALGGWDYGPTLERQLLSLN